MSMVQPLVLALFLGPVVVAAATDTIAFRVPNFVPLLLVIGFPLAAVLNPATPFDWSDHLLGGAAALSLGLVAFASGIMGGGDAKLLAALALWSGLHQLLPLVLVISVLGGLLAVVVTGLRRLPLAALLPGLHWRVLEREAPLPYAVAIAGGALWLAGHAWPG